MEENNSEDSIVLPWCLFLHLLQPQHLDLGSEVLRRCALWHSVCPLLPLVRHFSAFGLRGLLLWLQVPGT